MQFKEGARVLTSDGKHVGSIDRVVLNPQTQAVIGLVTRRGFLLTEDKVIPISLVGTTTEAQITLQKTKHDIRQLPRFEEKYYVPVHPDDLSDDQATSLYEYPPVGVTWWGFGSYLEPMPVEPETPYVEHTKRNIPEDAITIREGTRVVTAKGDHIGNVEEVLTDNQTNRATHLVISHGRLFKERKLIPTTWIKLEDEEEVILTVNSQTVDHLPGYVVA